MHTVTVIIANLPQFTCLELFPCARACSGRLATGPGGSWVTGVLLMWVVRTNMDIPNSGRYVVILIRT